jgi:hypothetical protein
LKRVRSLTNPLSITLAIAVAMLLAAPAFAQTVPTSPIGVKYKTFASAAAAQAGCGSALNVAWVSGSGAPPSYVPSGGAGAGTGPGTWACLSEAVSAGFPPSSCPSPDNVTWVDVNAKTFWNPTQSGYKTKPDGTGGYMCRSFALRLNFTQGSSPNDFTAQATPQLVKNCTKPAYIVWVSADNKNYVPVDDSAAGKGVGGYACSDVTKAHGYPSHLTGATTPDALKCVAPNVPVWFNQNEQNFFTPGSQGYIVKVGAGSFICSNDAADLQLTDASKDIIGEFSADSLKCNPDKPVWLPHGSANFYAQHDPVAPTGPVKDGVGLWICSNYANQHSIFPALTSWTSPGAAKCPNDVVVMLYSTYYNEKNWYHWQDTGGKYTCELIAKDLSYSPDGSNRPVVQTWPVHQQYMAEVSCPKVSDVPVFIVQGGALMPHKYLPETDELAGRFGPGDWVCQKVAVAQGYTKGQAIYTAPDSAKSGCGGDPDFVGARPYTISGTTYWDWTQSNGYLTPKQVGYGTGKGFYVCPDVAQAQFQPSHAPLAGGPPTICGDNQRATNAIWMNMRDGSQCIADADKITSIAQSAPTGAWKYVIVFGGQTQLLDPNDVVTVSAFLSGQSTFPQPIRQTVGGQAVYVNAPLLSIWQQYKQKTGK